MAFTFLLFLSVPLTGIASGFPDVTTGNTFHDEIEALSSEGIISGYPDGTFKPDHMVTRAQAAVMIGKALELNGEPQNTHFADVNSNVTGSGYIASAVDRGIITGFNDGSFSSI